MADNLNKNKNDEFDEFDENDDFVRWMREIAKKEKENPMVYLKIPEREKAVNAAKRMLKDSIDGNVEISEWDYLPHMGSLDINIKGKEIVVTDPAVFAFVLKNSSGFSADSHRKSGEVEIIVGYDDVAEGIGRIND